MKYPVFGGSAMDSSLKEMLSRSNGEIVVKNDEMIEYTSVFHVYYLSFP
jgi:hypothetical protein